MTETASSTRYQSQTRPHQRPTTTPAIPPATTPFLSPRLASPHRRSKAPQTPSPNYFAFQADGSSHLADSSQYAKGNWSPPSSTVRSTAALSPSVVPLDQNPEFDAFRKQSEGKAFNLAGLNSFKMNMPNPNTTAKPAKSNSHPSAPQQLKLQTQPREISTHTHRTVLDSSAAELSRSPKRVLSPGSATESNRKGSPPFFNNPSDGQKGEPDASESLPRFKLPLDTLNRAYAKTKQRAESSPVTNDGGSQLMVTPQHIVNLLDSRPDGILLLDLRVATQYGTSHVTSALNLCIPTTLLKRPSFNVHKLAETFTITSERNRFENWRSSSYIVVYDASSASLKDAAICINTINKFRTEGYEGILYIVRGGFSEFSKSFPTYVESRVASTSASAEWCGPEVAPVVGGCPMPETDKPANPFFGNIRQNMDLIGGVGQLSLKHPSKETKSVESAYPEWLKDAADDRDQGKQVSKKFEQIERREKKRMEEALSGKIAWGVPGTPSPSCVQIAGLEKGNKNRYNNIWPFEHSRVRLQNVPSHGCDYFNASHIKAAWSNKRYISTQAPVPATMNDFWNVIWQQDVRVVVMLTAEKEGAQIKAHNYWEQKQYGPLHLDFLSEKRVSLEPSRIHRHQKRPSAARLSSTKSQNPDASLAPFDTRDAKGEEQPYATVRKFTIKHERYPFEPMREITQLQYSSWPDFGAPTHPAHLLGLVQQCDNVVRATQKKPSGGSQPVNSRPVLVHCSAGCGRTGTFCTVDSVIDMLKQQKKAQAARSGSPMDLDSSPKRGEPKDSGGDSRASQPQEQQDDMEDSWVQRNDQDLVEKTVEDFRHQRLSMVQSLRQYVLCYESVMEWLVDQRLEHGA